MGSRHVRYTKALLACDVLTLFVLWTSQGDKSRWQKWLRVACCVFDSRPAETFVKFCPAKPGVPVWSILSLRDENFCNAGFHCQCYIFMHLLHPNPKPNSICLEPSCCHVNQTSSPCHWTCRHRCGQQFHSRRPGCGNILARFFWNCLWCSRWWMVLGTGGSKTNQTVDGNWTVRFRHWYTVTTFKYVEGGPDREAPEVVWNTSSYI